MLSSAARPWIEATLPVLLAHGERITRHFYQRLFSHHPELKALFNLGHQAQGEQPQALAGAVYAFAAQIDQPAVMGPVLDRIAHKHVSLGIAPSQYTIVGRHLLAALGDVLGDAVTPEIAAAWDEVYWLMAVELIAREARLYAVRDWSVGQAWRRMEVVAKQASSVDTVALVLRPIPGERLPDFQAGQYLSVAVPLPQQGLTQIRQYSFSQAPGAPTWRITVKRVAADGASPAGWVSNAIHDHVVVGQCLEVGPPAGEFCVHDGQHPVVLLSAGVGITPMVAIVGHLARTQPQQPLVFAYATRDADHFPHWAELVGDIQQLAQAQAHVWLERGERGPAGLDAAMQGRWTWHTGRMDLHQIEGLPPEATYGLCGPRAFMQAQRQALLARGVKAEAIRYELFGPEVVSGLP